MRYRRMSYRYSVVLASGEPRPFGDRLVGLQSGVHIAQTCWRPPTDVYETADATLVTVDIAGVDVEMLDVTLFADAVVVEGRRRLPAAGENGFFHAAEIRQGPFRLELAFPTEIDAERVEGEYDRGLLRLTIPKLSTR
jgi:HSP20 family protein